MSKEEIDEAVGYISGLLNDALGMAQTLESDCEDDERFSKLRETIEETMDYCNNLLDSL